MGPELQRFFEAFFRTYNSGDEEAHVALWIPDMTFFGSLLKTSVQGIGTTRGVFRAVREGVGIRKMEPVQWFGDEPELGALVRFKGEGGIPEADAAVTFKLTADRLLERLSVHWDPGSFLKAKEAGETLARGRETLADKDPRVMAALDGYFKTLSSGDNLAHVPLLHPDIFFYGSLSHVELQGRETAIGIFKAGRDSMGIKHFSPKKFYGDWPEVTAWVEMSREDGLATAEAMFCFRLDSAGIITRVALLWNPLPYLLKIGKI